MSAKADQRRAEIKLLLETAARPVSLRSLAASLNVTVRTLQRDISQLHSNGIRINVNRGRLGGVELADRHATRDVHERPFIGRRNLLEVSNTAARNSLNDGLQAVLVQGEAGIGKSRLLSELAKRLDAADWQVAWGRCFERLDESGLWP